MNLRNEFAKILEKYGRPVLIVRQDKKLRCSCWSEKTQEADRTCPRCFGLGWNPIVEKHMARTQDLTTSDTVGRLTSNSGFGQIAVANRTYFFQHNVNISTKDLIVDVDWTPAGKPVYNGGDINAVGHIDDTLRLEKGEIVYVSVACKDTPVQKNIRAIRIVQVNGIVNYELTMEDV